MRIRIVVVITALVVALLGAVSAPSSATFAGDGSITGFVEGPDGPIDVNHWLRVTALRQDRGSWYGKEGRRHEDGTYVIDNLDPGRYLLFFDTVPPNEWLADDNRYADVSPQWFPGTGDFTAATEVVVRADEVTAIDPVTLPRAGHLAGQVVDPDGGRLEQYVNVTARTLGPWGWQRGVTVRADDDGNYDLPLASDAPYVVEATGGQFSGPRALDGMRYDADAEFATTYNGSVADLDAAPRLHVASGEVEQVPDIRAVANGHLTGTVLGPDGLPVAGLRVQVPDARNRPELEVTTDSNGFWDAGPIGAGTYEVFAHDPDGVYAEKMRSADGTPQPRFEGTVRVAKTTHITTTVQWAPPRLVMPPLGEWADDTRVPVGTVLSVDAGAWEPSSDVTVQWRRGERGLPIPGATDWTYRVSEDDLGMDVYAWITATDPRGSEPTELVAVRVVASEVPGAETDPLGLSNPTIDDVTPTWGQVLQAGSAPGEATGWQWYRDGAPVSGATASTYAVGAADEGSRLAVAATSPDDSGRPRAFALSLPTQPVTEVDPSVSISATSTASRTVQLSIKVRARGVSSRHLDSAVTVSRVRPGNDTIKRASMKDGTLRITLRNQPTGRRVFYATVHGVAHRFVTSASPKRSVKVR